MVIRRFRFAFIGLLYSSFLLGGCGSNGDLGSHAPFDPSVAVISRSAPTSEAEVAKLFEQLQSRNLDLNQIRARSLAALTPESFRASASYAKLGNTYSFSFSDADPAGGRSFVYDASPPSSVLDLLDWPDHTATNTALAPQVNAAQTMESNGGEVGDDGVTLSLENLDQPQSLVLTGLTPPSGPNVTFLSNAVYRDPNTNLIWGRGFQGTVNLSGGRTAYFDKGVFAGPLRQTSQSRIHFGLRPNRSISIVNMTASLPTALNTNTTTLDFDIEMTNTTLGRWSVDLQQNNTTIKSFSPSVDLRGPGTSSGFNPVHVSLPWDGRDGNNNRVVGNYTWVASANTTSFVNGGALNDGIDSAQARLGGTAMNGTLLASVKQISSSSIELLDVNNEKIKLPQYDVDLKKKDPIALPIRDAFPVLNVTLSALLPEGEPQTYFFWGETLAGEKIFQAQHTPINGLNQVVFTVNVAKIAKHPTIRWYYAPKSGGTIGPMGTTDSPIYVTLDTPQSPQEKPRIDVVDFAVKAEANNDSLNELQIAAYLATRIYKDSGFLYDKDGEPHHTITNDPRTGRQMRLKVSNFLGDTDVDPYGNCQDFSNLFQVCGAALGTRSLEVRRVDGPFRFRRVWPVGFTDWFPDGFTLVYHQTGWSSEVRSVFDPTYQLDNGGQPLLPINMQPENYRLLLQDRSQTPDRWSEQASVRPLSVE